MAQNTLTKVEGLYSYPNLLSAIPQGALVEASNVFINRTNVAEPRRGFKIYGNAMDSSSTIIAKQLFVYKDRILRHYGSGSGNTIQFDSDGLGNFQSFSGTFSETSSGLRIKSVESNGNFYFTTSTGIKKISVANSNDLGSVTITNSGGIKALDLSLALNTSTSGFLLDQSIVAYRLVWGIKDSNENEILGTPSQRNEITNTTGSSCTVDLTFTIPQNVTTAYFYQIYRTPIQTATGVVSLSDLDPGDEEQLVFESNPTSGDLTNGFITVNDVTPESFLGAFLYTNENSGEGIAQANEPPPLSTDIVTFKGYTFYSNTSTSQSLNLSLLSVENLVSNVSTITLTDGVTSNTYTFRSVADGGEDIATKHILISGLPTPAQQVNETSRSIERVINRQSSEIVYCYYLSGPSDVPGLLFFQARNLGQDAFHITSDSTLTGDEFSPMVPTSGNTVISTNEISPNRLYYSKFSQPEAVPLLNYIDLGPKDKKIIRILALRDSLFVLKEEGVYRVTGLVAPFAASLFDSSTVLFSPDSAVVLNNLIYLHSNQGVARISDTGIEIVSRAIEDLLLPLTTPAFSSAQSASFGVSYESDRSYYFFTLNSSLDTTPSICYKYNTFTNSWTTLDISKNCGILNTFNDLLYLGATDTNFIEVERKSFNRTDYADREITLVLSANKVTNKNIILPSVSQIAINDILFQLQYVTINQFNRLLKKLDSDHFLNDKDYFSTLQLIPSGVLNTTLDSLITKIANDIGRLSVLGHTSSATYLALTPTSTNFQTAQTTFNSLISLLNGDPGLAQKNYPRSMGNAQQEVLITNVINNINTITTQYAYPFLAGDVLVYKHFDCVVTWVPQSMQDASMLKHVSEGTLLFYSNNFTNGTISYSSDLSSGFESINFLGEGNGNFGNFIYGTGDYGGSGDPIPLRTYIPLEKQRCRLMNCRFTHQPAREGFLLYGMSLTYNTTSTRGYR